MVALLPSPLLPLVSNAALNTFKHTFLSSRLIILRRNSLRSETGKEGKKEGRRERRSRKRERRETMSSPPPRDTRKVHF